MAATGFGTLAWIVLAVALVIAGLVLVRAASVRVDDDVAGRKRPRP